MVLINHPRTQISCHVIFDDTPADRAQKQNMVLMPTVPFTSPAGSPVAQEAPAVACAYGTSTEQRRDRWAAIIQNIWLKRMLRGWVFRTDKLLEIENWWRRAACSLEKEALLYSLQAVTKQKHEAKLSEVPSTDQFVDCTHIRFCVGPCNSTLTESSLPGHERLFLKPYTPGKRYKKFSYGLQNGKCIELQNLRMCSSCVDRYNELMHSDEDDERAREMMHRDAMALRRKLFQQCSFMLANQGE